MYSELKIKFIFNIYLASEINVTIR